MILRYFVALMLLLLAIGCQKVEEPDELFDNPFENRNEDFLTFTSIEDVGDRPGWADVKIEWDINEDRINPDFRDQIIIKLKALFLNRPGNDYSVDERVQMQEVPLSLGTMEYCWEAFFYNESQNILVSTGDTICIVLTN